MYSKVLTSKPASLDQIYLPLGQLGFHIQFQGIVGDVRENGPAWVAGLRPGSRLLEVRS